MTSVNVAHPLQAATFKTPTLTVSSSAADRDVWSSARFFAGFPEMQHVWQSYGLGDAWIENTHLRLLICPELFSLT